MRYARLFLFMIASVACVTAVNAQERQMPPDGGQNDDRSQNRRPDVLGELALSPDQFQQIRELNRERRPKMMEARRKMGEAARNLDLAIYGDSVNEAEIQSRLKEFQAAEAEVARLRFEGELAVRKILTPEQLVRFRELRRRYAEVRREEIRNRRGRRGGRGLPRGVTRRNQPPSER